MERFVVIMAGGVGSRFWPRSRKKSPKQLLNIFGQQTMIQETYHRINKFVTPEHVLIITNKVQKALIEDQLPEIPKKNIIAEPVGRNTAPCIGVAARIISNISKDSVFVTLPADHLIEETEEFIRILEKGTERAYSSGGLFTFGIKPTRPETGYGYINFDQDSNDDKIYKVKKFVEKPDLKTAEEYLRSGDYFWNSGMFIWRTDVILNEFKKYLPSVYSGLQKIEGNFNEAELLSSLSEIYPDMENISIDYGIMERSDNVYSIEGNFGWNDVGSWQTVYEIESKDDNGNAEIGDVYSEEVNNSYIYSPGKFTAVIGVSDLVIINTDDALLVCDREKTQNVKNVVDFLNDQKRYDLT